MQGIIYLFSFCTEPRILSSFQPESSAGSRGHGIPIQAILFCKFQDCQEDKKISLLQGNLES